MVVDSLYGIHGDRPTDQVTLPIDLTEAVRKALQSVYRHHSSASDLVPEELFRGITETIDDAVPDELADKYPTLTETIRHNNEVFSAFKVHDECSRMAQLLLDGDGNLKSFEQWRRDAEPIASHHNKVWLRTEYDQAIRRAEQARDWKQYEAESDVLPNLRWVPSTAAHPNADHMAFWNTVLPISDPFWNRHKPGDRWGCQCSLEATDEPVTGTPDGTPHDDPSPGLQGNPAKTGKLFSEDHPYYPKSCASCPFSYGEASKSPTNKIRDCYTCKYYRECTPLFAKRRKEVLNEAKKILPQTIGNKTLPDVHLSKTSFTEWLNQPHKHYAVKNEILLDLEGIFKRSKYICNHPPYKQRDIEKGIVLQYFFEIEILGDKSWIIVDKFSDGNVKLHGVSDSEKVLKEP